MGKYSQKSNDRIATRILTKKLGKDNPIMRAAKDFEAAALEQAKQKRLMVSMPDIVFERLRGIAYEQNKSIAKVVREAVMAHIEATDAEDRASFEREASKDLHR